MQYSKTSWLAASVISGFLLFTTDSPSLAQTADLTLNPTTPTTYVHEYARPGRPTMTVFIWGEVRTSGIWKVEPGVDLIELLSAANVAGTGRINVGTDTRYELQIHRANQSERRQIYKERIDVLLNGARDYPALEPGDVLVVEAIQRRRFDFQQATQILGAVSSLTLLIIRLSRL